MAEQQKLNFSQLPLGVATTLGVVPSSRGLDGHRIKRVELCPQCLLSVEVFSGESVFLSGSQSSVQDHCVCHCHQDHVSFGGCTCVPGWTWESSGRLSLASLGN